MTFAESYAIRVRVSEEERNRPPQRKKQMSGHVTYRVR